ncbi:hypothetical protein WA026_016923 [Henosepilachna vigintioctopunctata]|uniref:Uncharacterized protein n=1 Tax=Henosepilachna vigintioctopunctata TaxID=420089 RepID=A0AAW1UAV4_9CUCU
MGSISKENDENLLNDWEEISMEEVNDVTILNSLGPSMFFKCNYSPLRPQNKNPDLMKIAKKLSEVEEFSKISRSDMELYRRNCKMTTRKERVPASEVHLKNKDESRTLCKETTNETTSKNDDSLWKEHVFDSLGPSMFFNITYTPITPKKPQTRLPRKS